MTEAPTPATATPEIPKVAVTEASTSATQTEAAAAANSNTAEEITTALNNKDATTHSILDDLSRPPQLAIDSKPYVPEGQTSNASNDVPQQEPIEAEILSPEEANSKTKNGKNITDAEVISEESGSNTDTPPQQREPIQATNVRLVDNSTPPSSGDNNLNGENDSTYEATNTNTPKPESKKPKTLQEMTQAERIKYYEEMGREFVKTVHIDSDAAAAAAIQEISETLTDPENSRRLIEGIIEARKRGESVEVDITKIKLDLGIKFINIPREQVDTFSEKLSTNPDAIKLVLAASSFSDLIRNIPGLNPSDQQELIKSAIDGMIQELTKQRDAENNGNQPQNAENKNTTLSLLIWLLQLIMGAFTKSREPATASASN